MKKRRVKILFAVSFLLIMAGGCARMQPQETISAYLSALRQTDFEAAMVQVQGGTLPENFSKIENGMCAYWKASELTLGEITEHGEASASAIVTLTAPDTEALNEVLRLMAAEGIYELSQQTELTNEEFQTQGVDLMIAQMEWLDLSTVQESTQTLTVQLIKEDGVWKIAEGSDFAFSLLKELQLVKDTTS